MMSHWFCPQKQYRLLAFPPNTAVTGATSMGELLSLKTVVSSSPYDCEEKLEMTWKILMPLNSSIPLIFKIRKLLWLLRKAWSWQYWQNLFHTAVCNSSTIYFLLCFCFKFQAHEKSSVYSPVEETSVLPEEEENVRTHFHRRMPSLWWPTLPGHDKACHAVWHTGSCCQESDAHDHIWNSQRVPNDCHLRSGNKLSSCLQELRPETNLAQICKMLWDSSANSTLNISFK